MEMTGRLIDWCQPGVYFRERFSRMHVVPMAG